MNPFGGAGVSERARTGSPSWARRIRSSARSLFLIAAWLLAGCTEAPVATDQPIATPTPELATSSASPTAGSTDRRGACDFLGTQALTEVMGRPVVAAHETGSFGLLEGLRDCVYVHADGPVAATISLRQEDTDAATAGSLLSDLATILPPGTVDETLDVGDAATATSFVHCPDPFQCHTWVAVSAPPEFLIVSVPSAPTGPDVARALTLALVDALD